jgi:hypothetical protein
LKLLPTPSGALGLEQAHGVGVVAEEVAVLAVGDVRQQLDRLRPRRIVALSGGVIQRLDRGHGHGNVALQGGLGIAEQTLAGLLDLLRACSCRMNSVVRLMTSAKSNTGRTARDRTLAFRLMRMTFTLLILLAWVKPLSARQIKS